MNKNHPFAAQVEAYRQAKFAEIRQKIFVDNMQKIKNVNTTPDHSLVVYDQTTRDKNNLQSAESFCKTS